MKKGPAGRSRGALLWSAPASGQRRCLGSGAGGLRRWSRSMAVADGMAPGCACGAWEMQSLCPIGDLRGRRLLSGFLRIVLDRHGLRNLPAQLRTIPPAGPGRPRSRPFSWVTGLLSPAVRSLPWSEVPRRTARSVRLIAPASHAWFFRARPWLARTSGPTKGCRCRSRAVRVRGDAYVRTRNVDFRVRSCRGRAPAASWRGRCRACPAPAGSGPGSPSRGRGSPGGRRR